MKLVAFITRHLLFVRLADVAGVIREDQRHVKVVSPPGLLVVLEADPVLGDLDQDVLVVHLGAGVDDDRLHPDDRHTVL